MSKPRIAMISFALGAISSFLLVSRGQIVAMGAQSPSPTPQAPPTLTPAITGGQGLPTVPPITSHFVDFGLSVPGKAFAVDGAECVRCVFNDTVLRYGGGNFQFTDFKFSGPVRVELVGAAANTAVFLQFVNALEAGQAPPKPPVQNAPIIKTAMVKNTAAGSFGTSTK